MNVQNTGCFNVTAAPLNALPFHPAFDSFDLLDPNRMVCVWRSAHERLQYRDFNAANHVHTQHKAHIHRCRQSLVGISYAKHCECIAIDWLSPTNERQGKFSLGRSHMDSTWPLWRQHFPIAACNMTNGTTPCTLTKQLQQYGIQYSHGMCMV